MHVNRLQRSYQMLPLQNKLGLTLVQRSAPCVRNHAVNACVPAVGQQRSSKARRGLLKQRPEVQLLSSASVARRFASQVRMARDIGFMPRLVNSYGDFNKLLCTCVLTTCKHVMVRRRVALTPQRWQLRLAQLPLGPT